RRARHQVRNVRRTPRARRHDRRPPSRCLAARRPPAATRARCGARSAAARVGSDEKRLSRTIVRINTIEATSPLATGEHFDESCLPTALVPSEPDSPDKAYEKAETRDRVRAAIASLPIREQKVI